MTNKLAIYPLHPAGSNDQGMTYAVLDEIQNRGMLAATRYQGSVSGKHFHKGLVSEKNPEILVLLSGEAALFWHDLTTDEHDSQELSAPTLIYIFPWLWHELKATTLIHFAELNSLQAHTEDTFYNLP